ncbi:hypothetical protein BH23THE1_BH23THE1_34440 [soil metagenome]
MVDFCQICFTYHRTLYPEELNPTESATYLSNMYSSTGYEYHILCYQKIKYGWDLDKIINFFQCFLGSVKLSSNVVVMMPSKHLNPLLDMFYLAVFLSTRKVVIETFGSVLNVLHRSFNKAFLQRGE